MGTYSWTELFWGLEMDTWVSSCANYNDDKWFDLLGPRETKSTSQGGLVHQISFGQYHVLSLSSQEILTEILVTVTYCGN